MSALNLIFSMLACMLGITLIAIGYIYGQKPFSLVVGVAATATIFTINQAPPFFGSGLVL